MREINKAIRDNKSLILSDMPIYSYFNRGKLSKILSVKKYIYKSDYTFLYF